jgi:energy-coupling factor transporter ATP-binding protein EcfA2
MADNLLEVAGIETCYGQSQVLFDLSFVIARGEMVTLMGRNGMGKTTTVRSIMGLTPARAGAIRFGGAEIRTLPAYRIAQRGLGLVPEGRQIFPNLTTWSRPRPTAPDPPILGRSRRCAIFFHASPSVSTAWAASSPGASNRCSPSAAR